jgi:hypothetical protein
VRPVGFGKFKKIISSGIETATFRFVTQCLSHYAPWCGHHSSVQYGAPIAARVTIEHTLAVLTHLNPGPGNVTNMYRVTFHYTSVVPWDSELRKAVMGMLSKN